MVLGTCGNSFPSRQIYEAFTWSSELQQLSPFIREKVVPPDPPAELSSPPPSRRIHHFCVNGWLFFKKKKEKGLFTGGGGGGGKGCLGYSRPLPCSMVAVNDS